MRISDCFRVVYGEAESEEIGEEKTGEKEMSWSFTRPAFPSFYRPYGYSVITVSRLLCLTGPKYPPLTTE